MKRLRVLLFAACSAAVLLAQDTVVVLVRHGEKVSEAGDAELSETGLLRAERRFCLAVIPEGDKAMLGHFAAGFAPGVDPLAGIPHATSSHGIAYPTAACAHFECELLGEADWTDHLVLCGKVIGGDARPEPRPWVHLRKNGLRY